MARDDDGGLAERAARGDDAAFEELVRRHEDRIFALALRMTGNRADALDATQDTFVRAYRKAREFRGDAAWSTWVYRIGINCCRDLLRSRARLPVPDDDPGRDRPAPATRIDDAAVARVDVARALERLGDDFREAVVMHDIGGVPYEDIARATGVSVGTVKSRISRGRRKLAELLEPRAEAGTSKDTT
ncbi:MAG TPA: sigma-70 family RNA polymerase sigma factor [Actinomycetota bacterium]|nr:sigma-70 family RNA polymerase sigma factor [Actinomycetota bacterium]